jgi:hypothetical protein
MVKYWHSRCRTYSSGANKLPSSSVCEQVSFEQPSYTVVLFNRSVGQKMKKTAILQRRTETVEEQLETPR